MNEIAQLCEKVGADVKSVAKGVGLDNRIGPRFLQAAWVMVVHVFLKT